ncbi:MAG: YbjQ family protein [Phycisphaerales bacterium]
MSLPVTTTFTFDGHRVKEYRGIVRGIIVRAPTISQGILGGFKSIIGGRIGAYTEMCEQARQQAYELMIDHAKAVGANAILGFHYDASDVGGGGKATEVLCYGTAVVIEATQSENR